MNMMTFYFVHFLLTSHSVVAILLEGIMVDDRFPFFHFQNSEEISIVLFHCVFHLIQYYHEMIDSYHSLYFRNFFLYQNRLDFELVGCETSNLGVDLQRLRN